MTSLEKLLESNEPIYVVNNTKDRGRVMLTLTHPGTGRIESVYIPVTWIPICITDMVPREMLKASLDFRKYVANGILKIVPAEEAREILKSEEAQEELRRIYESDFARHEPEAKTMETMETVAEEPTPVEDVSPKVHDIILRLESGSLTPRQAISKLKSLAGSLTKVDLSFLVANSPSDQVRSWAEKQLARME